MAVKVYIDGQEGTTGLKILERFEGRNDIELLRISEDKRKDSAERARLINMSDYTFLCLPDDAAREAVSFVDNDHVRIIDASTAHRTNPDWAYGFPELSPEHRDKIRTSNRVAVPGCYASGFASIVYPLVHSGIIPADYPVFAYATSGYSGAGKKAIAVYEGDDKPLKYPLMFTVSDIMLVNKIDTAPIFDFDLAAARDRARALNPAIRVFPVSAKTGEGFAPLADELYALVKKKKGAGV